MQTDTSSKVMTPAEIHVVAQGCERLSNLGYVPITVSSVKSFSSHRDAICPYLLIPPLPEATPCDKQIHPACALP